MTPVALLILDGFGIGKPYHGNAIYRARTPTFEYLNAHAFVRALQASGTAVGLPFGEAGNSEVGHLTIGAGRIIHQYMTRITAAIRDGSFLTNWALRGAARYARTQGSALHLMGLVSSGSVHAYLDHVYALLELAKAEGLSRVALHVFADGKDALPREAASLLPRVEAKMRDIGVGAIASIVGRHYSMNRDQQWDRTEEAYRLLTAGKGNRITDVEAYCEAQYEKGLTDDMVEPAIVAQKDGSVLTIGDNDAVIFFNFREDSARQLTHAFVDADFPHFARPPFQGLHFITMTEYEKGLHARAAFAPPEITSTLGETVARAKLRQLRVAETEKYAHITYFFDGARDVRYDGEKKELIPSRGGNPDDHPEMRAAEIADAISDALAGGSFEFIAANFANADMAGHTGNMEAAIKAVETLDAAVNKILRALAAHNYALLITADHGNAEQKIDPVSGRVLSEHTANPVPFYAIGGGIQAQGAQGPLHSLPTDGYLADVAPTVLNLLGADAPKEMTGRNLLN